VRALPVLAVLLLAGGLGCFAVAAARGEASAGIVVVFPVILGGGPWAFLGGLLLMGGMMAGFAAFAERARTSASEAAPPDVPRTRAGGIVLIGPIPIVVATDRGLARALLLLALALAIALLAAWALLGGKR
jgi:uncharacterized protein (TIGR00304 family)